MPHDLSSQRGHLHGPNEASNGSLRQHGAGSTTGSVGEEAVGNAMTTAVGNLVKTLRMTTESHFDSHSLVEMRQFIVLLLDPSLIEYACEETHQRQVLDLQNRPIKEWQASK